MGSQRSVGTGDIPAANGRPIPANPSERGFVLILMALSSVAILAALGLAVDIGRMFITKNETQIFCDSAALSAALALDGTTGGIARAQASVASSSNHWNLNNTPVSNPAVVFATSLAGPWVASPNPATNFGFARVSATAPLRLYFLPVVVAQNIQSVASLATAAQVDITNFPRGLAPYTAVSTNMTAPHFGLVVGQEYDIQWPQFSASKCTGKGSLDKCFNSPPCSGESNASKQAVVDNWGSNFSGYWGSTSNSTIERQILDVIQLGAVEVGTNIEPLLASGDKATEARFLDERANQDVNITDNTVSTYLSGPHNGRRLIPVPIVNPSSPSDTSVIGYGQFLLKANGPGATNYYVHNANGNDPFCAIYAGPYNVGSTGVGVGGTTGATRVKLVQ